MVVDTRSLSETAAERIPHRRSEAVDQDVEADELGFHFLAGRPCLDLVATIGERWWRGFERLRTRDALARWCVEAGLLAEPPAATDDDLAAARRLRGAIARTLFAWASGQPLDAGDVGVVNAAAAQADLPPSLATDATASPPTTGTVPAVLSTVARDAVDLLATGDPARLRECAADDCSLLFLDASRPGARRWCSMVTCGNRHKTSRYRNRRKDTS